jgi:hypothetical protein
MAGYAFALSRYAGEGLSTSSLAALRLTLVRGETLRLPRGSLSLRVVSGRAWIGSGSEEAVLRQGESAPIPEAPRYPCLVSAIGEEELSIVVALAPPR